MSIVDDNVFTNKCDADRIKCFFVRWASYRLDLGVNDFLDIHSSRICTVHKLMANLSNIIIISAQLRQFTPYEPLLSNITRWSLTFQMLTPYYQLRLIVPKINMRNVSDLMPNSADD